MWMSDPIPVTTRIITADSGSRRSVNDALKSPEVIHEKTGWVMTRDSGGSATSRQTAATDTMKDRRIEPHATAPAAALLMRLPRLALMTKPINGRSGIRRSMPSPDQGCHRLSTLGSGLLQESKVEDREPAATQS